MKRTLLALLAASLSGNAAFADEGWKQLVASDLVVVADGKMTSETYQLCKVQAKRKKGKTASFQIHTYAEATTDGSVSRDFFITFSTTTHACLLSQLGMSCHDIGAPIGTVDFEFSIYMTGDGYQLVFKNNADGSTVRDSKLWSEVFED